MPADFTPTVQVDETIMAYYDQSKYLPRYSGNTVHNLKCCVLTEYSYGHCNTFSSNYGVPIDCREHVSGTVLEDQCHSGKNADCHGDFNRCDAA